MKIIILLLSCNQKYFKKQCEETKRQFQKQLDHFNLNDNVKIYSYTSGTNEGIINDTIYCNTLDDYNHTYEKTIRCFEILDENNNSKTNIVVEQFEPLKGDQNHFATIIKNIKLSLNKDYGLSFVIDSIINDILLTNLSNVVLSINAYKSNITYSLQQLLKWWGYDAVINGKYGSNTEFIVSLFQSQVGLKKTGTTTKEFWYKILGK